jgi:FixJ family two-component response regulator
LSKSVEQRSDLPFVLERQDAVLDNSPVIAIVDDDAPVIAALQGLLRSLGFASRAFASAQDFIASSAVRECSCLISDVNMPGMDGFELQDALAAESLSIPTIFITAFPNEQSEARALKAGAVCYLHKPFKVPALISCIEKALQQAGSGHP